MTTGRHDRAIAALDVELETTEALLARLGREHYERLAKLHSTRWKIVRDAIGAGGGLLLAGPTTGLSLLVTFWTMTALLIDTLDAWRERTALGRLETRTELLLRRQKEIVDALEAMRKEHVGRLPPPSPAPSPQAPPPAP